MLIKEANLITIDSKDKLRVVYLTLSKEYGENIFYVRKTTGLVTGKKTPQPEKVFTEGKAGRTAEEQAKLQYDSDLKKFLDKGYKELSKDLRFYKESDLRELLSLIKTDSFGRIKPMLAKKIDDVSLSSINKVKAWFISKKIDGVRTMIYKDHKSNKLHSISRGGKDYDNSIQHILTDYNLIKFFENNPNYILDGELYIHGKPLQYISGLARTSVNENVNTEELQFWIFDAINTQDLTIPFEERYSFLKKIHEEYEFPFEEVEQDVPIRILTQTKIYFIEKAREYHNIFVQNGYEGAVVKDAESPYKPGARSNSMLKIKEYQDAEAKVIDKHLGLRGIEDMVFEMEMPNGIRFKAKPMGDMEIKQDYWDNFESKYKNQLGTYKYFTLSNDGVPTQPIFKAFRYDV